MRNIAFLLALAAFAAPAAAPAAETWQCYTYVAAASDPVYQHLQALAEQIDKAADGQLDVACHVGGALPVNVSTIAQSISQGTLQFGLIDSLSYNSLVPFAGVLSLPGLFGNAQQFAAGAAALKPGLEAAFAQRGVKLLGISTYPLQVIWSTQKVTSLADIKGMKIRVTTPEQAQFAIKFGAVPITLGMPDLPAALQRGIVTGMLTASAGGGRQLHDILKYNLRTGPNYVSVMLVANQARFDALAPMLQKNIAQFSAAAAIAITDTLESEEITLTEQFRKEGMVVTPGTPEQAEEIATKLRPYWAEWAKQKGPEAERALQTVLAALHRSN